MAPSQSSLLYELGNSEAEGARESNQRQVCAADEWERFFPPKCKEKTMEENAAFPNASSPEKEYMFVRDKCVSYADAAFDDFKLYAAVGALLAQSG